MAGVESPTLFLGAMLLGLIHGAEPGHGWPIAGTYALNRSRTYWHGFVASTLLGIGHLVSSLAVVGVFFLAKTYFSLSELDAPVIIGDVQLGGPVSIVAGVLLIILGWREYHSTAGHGDHTHHDHHGEEQATRTSRTNSEESGLVNRLSTFLRSGGHHHHHDMADDGQTQSLSHIVWTAFVLGFAHEEEFEIIGLCLGSAQCLALMIMYAIAVMLSLIGLTMLLIAGYHRYEQRLEAVQPYFPMLSAGVLVILGTGFLLGLL